MSTYKIEEEGLIHDSTRIDARQLRLRLWKDGEYHQFFTVAVPGIDFRDFPDGTDQAGGFWQSIRRQAAQGIKRWIENGGQPLVNPTMAVELQVNAEQARKEARKRPSRWVDSGERRVIGRFEI